MQLFHPVSYIAETITSAGGEGQVYEQVNGGEGGVILPTWRLEQEEEEEEEGTPYAVHTK